MKAHLSAKLRGASSAEARDHVDLTILIALHASVKHLTFVHQTCWLHIREYWMPGVPAPSALRLCWCCNGCSGSPCEVQALPDRRSPPNRSKMQCHDRHIFFAWIQRCTVYWSSCTSWSYSMTLRYHRQSRLVTACVSAHIGALRPRQSYGMRDTELWESESATLQLSQA